jgi:hypothetical protein
MRERRRLSTTSLKISGPYRSRSFFVLPISAPTIVPAHHPAFEENAELRDLDQYIMAHGRRVAACRELPRVRHPPLFSTQRGLRMRRTFNGLMRAAQVKAIVTRSISGHLTEQMQDFLQHRSGAEERASIAKVIDPITPRNRQHAAGLTPSPARQELPRRAESRQPLPGHERMGALRRDPSLTARAAASFRPRRSIAIVAEEANVVRAALLRSFAPRSRHQRKAAALS